MLRTPALWLLAQNKVQQSRGGLDPTQQENDARPGHPAGGGCPSPAYQGLQLFGVNEVELRDKVVEVLVAGVDMRLGAHLCDAVEMVDVHVHEHPEQPRQDLAHCLQEGLGKWRTWRWAEGPGRKPVRASRPGTACTHLNLGNLA